MKLKFIAIIILILTSVSTSSAEPTPTTPIQVNFNYKNWGSYYTVSYAGEQYFAGYAGGGTLTSTNIFTFDSVSNSGQMHKVSGNDDTSRMLVAGGTMALNGGYVIMLKDVDITGGKIASLSLLDNGYEVDTTKISEGGTYIYTKKVGDIINLPLIAIHVSNVSIASITGIKYINMDGIFLITEGFIKVTTTNGSSSYVTVTPVIPTPQKPKPTPTPTRGSISVSSSPSGASIYLDGAYQEKTPKTITDVSIGSHALEFTLEGYKPGSEFIEVSASSTSYVSISLIPIVTTPTPTFTPTVTPTVTPTPTVSPSPIATANLEQEVKELKERLNKTEEKQNQQKNKIFWLESAINSILEWLKSIF